MTLYYNGNLIFGEKPPIVFSGISCDLDFSDNSGYTDHWLPNTGDALALASITVKGKDDRDADVIKAKCEYFFEFFLKKQEFAS